MGTFKIEGGHQLKGSIQPQGAKNEALQILCAVLLTPEKVTIHNIPDIIDINKLIALLKKLGVKVEKLNHGSSRLTSHPAHECQRAIHYSIHGTIQLGTPLAVQAFPWNAIRKKTNGD